jgi:hypothetical protein
VRDAIVIVLETLEPKGMEAVPDTFAARNRGKFAAFNTMGAIARAEENLPLSASREELLKARLKKDLGDAALRRFHNDLED